MLGSDLAYFGVKSFLTVHDVYIIVLLMYFIHPFSTIHVFPLSSSQMSERKPLTYDELLRQLVDEESQYVRHLNLILKVFMEPFNDRNLFLAIVSTVHLSLSFSLSLSLSLSLYFIIIIFLLFLCLCVLC